MKSLKYFFVIILTAVFCLQNINSSFADDKNKKKPKKDKKKKEVIKFNYNVTLSSLGLKVAGIKRDESFYVINTEIAERWYPIVYEIREAEVSKQAAIDSMNRFTNNLWDFLEKYVKAGRIKKYSDKDWVFPVKGYSPTAIGGFGGNGYTDAGFDFFSQNSGGHPAHDIFIADRNQDCMDDYTGEPVEILSMSGGIVVETRKNWDNTMTDIKGGNIVYVYDNFTNGLFYYAHLKEVDVSVGDFVEPGTTLGIMGRSGKNAYPSRSPTHLHLMYVRSYDGDLQPENIYKDLLQAKLIP